MKTKLSLLFCLLINVFVLSQEKVNSRAYNILYNTLSNELKDYNCSDYNKPKKAVQEKVLSDNLFNIYKAVLPSSGGSNLNAFTYALNKDKQTLGLSFSKNLGVDKKTFFTAKINLEGNNFPLFTEKRWSKKLGFKLGFDRVISSSQFFNKKGCEDIIKKRKVYADSLKLKYFLILKKDSNDLSKLDSIKLALEEDLKRIYSVGHLSKIKKEKKSTVWKKWRKLDSIKKEINNYKELSKISTVKEAKKELRNMLVSFDKRNDILTGYKVVWFSVNGGYGINESALKVKDEVDKKIDFENPEYSFDLALRYNKFSNRSLQYVSLVGGVKKTGMLSYPSLIHSGVPYLIKSQDTYQVFTGDDLAFLDDSANINNTFWQYNLSFYYANFFAFKQTVGVSLDMNVNDKMTSDKFAELYKMNYGVNLGLLFRNVNESDFSKATFGISAGFESVPNNVSSNDYFTVKAFVGVPFNVFKKK